MRSILEQKKGQVGSLPQTIILLVLAGVFLIFGLIILEKIRDTDIVDSGVDNAITREIITNAELTTGTDSVTLDGGGGGYCNPAGFAITTVTNTTDPINSANYSVTDAGVFTNLTSEFYEGNWNITYTFSSGGTACSTANQTVVGLGTFGDFWEIIVLAIVIAVVIGLLLVVFGGSRSR